MIKVVISKQGNDITKVQCAGHSGYAPKGKDIVCSAVSAIIQTALLALMDLSKEVLYQKEEGYLYFECPHTKNQEQSIRQQSILRAMHIGLKDIQQSYSSFIEMEVK